jgi:hypothetical protein
MLDLADLETEAEQLADQLRTARCCDALVPCYRCLLLKLNVLARRRVVEIPRAAPRGRARTRLCSAEPITDLKLRAS